MSGYDEDADGQVDGLIALQQKYLELRAEIDSLEMELKGRKQIVDEVQALLAEQMAAIGQTHTVLDGKRLTVRTTPRIGKLREIPMADFCRRLEDTDLEYLVQPGVHAMQLQAALKEIIEETGELPEYVAPMVRRWDQTVVAVSKA